jgi:response regulator RpfG family c-di-GMP phosphodiesterase
MHDEARREDTGFIHREEMGGKRVPLVGDPDPRFLHRLMGEARDGAPPPLVADNRADFLRYLAEAPERCSGIFLNPRLCDAHGVTLVRNAREKCPTTPIFLLLDGPSDIPRSHATRLTIRDSFRKPVSLADLTRAVDGALRPFNKQEVLELRSESDAELGVEFEQSDEDFVPIRAAAFLAGQESYFDVYVRINEKRYVKILTAGDAFTRDRLDAYLKRGIEHLYLRKRLQEVYLKYCDTLANAMLENTRVPVAVKVEQMGNWGEETVKLLRESGVNEGAVNYARSFTRKVHKLVKQLDLERFGAIRDYLQNNANVDHAVSTMMMASLISIPLRFDSERSAAIVGLAALFHDIGFERIEERISRANPAELSAEDLEVFQSHPILGREMLEGIPGIEPVVLQAVAQHHERRNGRGFPERLGPGSIGLVAEIIGLSEDIVTQVERVAKDPRLNLVREVEKNCYDGFSASVVSTIKIFLRD